ncbi:MAG: sulfatase [bacterium]|nr:sulfatase [bacterium]
MPHNILHFICHDLGRQLASYGNPTIPSPTLDAFAAEAVRFTNYFGASTPCSPSRGCIMTGKYAHTNGLIGLVNRGWDLPESEPTIVDALNGAGYETALIGFQHERKNPDHNHYGYQWGESIDAKAVAGHVAEYLETVEGPFYVNAGTFEVHLSFDQPHYVFDDPDAVQLPGYLVDAPENRLERARFHGAIRYMDEAFATILEAVDRTGHRDDTIVVFTTDHGEAFPRAKSTLYDAGIGTALIMRFPEGQTSVQDALLSNIDLMPTLLEAVGVEIPDGVQGRSFMGLMTGDGYAPRDCVFSEKNFHDHYDPVRAVRTDRYKYIRSFTDQPKILMPADIKASICTKALPQDAADPRGREELYDLRTDPGETNNRIDDPSLADVRAELTTRLDMWMQETNDPLLERIDLPYPPEQFD